jgi:hypothetical protein
MRHIDAVCCQPSICLFSLLSIFEVHTSI